MKTSIRFNKTLAFAATLAAAAGAAQAQMPPASYAGEQTRAIKALSDADIAGLLAGQGAGFAKAAELNGYPGPAHTLELKDRLSLDAEQVAATERLMIAHKARARDIGAALVQAELRLDAIFASRSADAAAVEQATRDVGFLHSQLRAEHLNTHLAQTALLNAEQVAHYSLLRGSGQAKPRTAPVEGVAPQPKHSHH